ncbi:hypothetical protein Tco_0439512 [Tanacetum coccineum]
MVKLMNIPIEAWRIYGLTMLIAKVLVEIDAKKEIKEEIKIKYTDKGNCVKCTKDVKVMYDWKPECYSHCHVFGHCFEKCKVRHGTEEEIKAKEEATNSAKKANEIEEGFTEVQNRKKNLQQ